MALNSVFDDQPRGLHIIVDSSFSWTIKVLVFGEVKLAHGHMWLNSKILQPSHLDVVETPIFALKRSHNPYIARRRESQYSQYVRSYELQNLTPHC